MDHVDQDSTTPTRPADPAPGDAEGTTRSPGGGRRLWLIVAVVAVVAVAIGGVLALSGGDDGDVTNGDEPEPGDDAATATTAEPGGTTVPAPAGTEPGETGGPAAGGDASAATVAVVFGDGGAVGEATELTLTFVGPDGSTVAERRWSEVEEGAEGAPAGQAAAMGGLIQGVPAGDLVLRATLGDATCEQPFTAAEGDRTILRVQPSALGVEADPMDAPMGAGGATSGAVGEPVDPDACAAVEPVEAWAAGRTGPTGEGYVGLAVEDVESRAAAAGLTTRVTGVDGMDLAVTMDLREDRLNLLTFDGVVVAAALDGEGGG
jgi:hypothetical protein